MNLSKTDLSEALSEDYAERAAKSGMAYNDAYDHYYERCMSRSEIDLYAQYKVQGLDTPKFQFLV